MATARRLCVLAVLGLLLLQQADPALAAKKARKRDKPRRRKIQQLEGKYTALAQDPAPERPGLDIHADARARGAQDRGAGPAWDSPFAH